MSEPVASPPLLGVPIRGPDGEVALYHPHDVAQALAAGGEVVAPIEYQQDRLEQKYGGLGGSVAATGLGAARGLSVGLSDPLAIGAARLIGGKEGADSARRTIGELQEAHPALSTAGELAGAIAPLLATDGGSAAESAGIFRKAANLLGAAPRAVAASGRLAEGIATMGGEKAMQLGLGARLIQRSVPAAIGGATEGALWGAGHEISDAAIDDHELTAEKLLAETGKGALFGGLTGGGLGAAGELLSGRTINALGSFKGESIADYLERKSGEAFFRGAGPTKKMVEAAERYAPGGFAGVGAIGRDEIPALVGKPGAINLTQEETAIGAGRGAAREGQALGDLLSQVDEAALRPAAPEQVIGLNGIAANENARPPLSWEREIGVPRTRPANENMGPEWENVKIPGAPAANDNAPGHAKFRKTIGAWQRSASASDLPANDTGAFVRGTQEMNPIAQRAVSNDNGIGVHGLPPGPKVALPRAADIVADIQSVQDELAKHVGTEAVQSRLNALLNSVKKVTGMIDPATGELVPHAGEIGITFTQLRNIRADIDNAWAGNSANPELMGFKKEFWRVRNKLEQRLEDGAAAVAEEHGINFAKPYAAAKQKYQAFKMIAKAADSGASRQGANQVFGLGDKIVGGNLGAWGAHIGSAVAGPPGAFVGGAIGGLGGAGLNKLVRERGNFFFSDVLHRLSQLASIQKINSDVDRKIAQGVRSFLIPGETIRNPKERSKRGVETDEDILATAKSVLASQNPAAMQARLEQLTGPLGTSAPGITQSIATKAATTMAFLASKAPHMRANVASLTPQFEKPRTSEAEVKKFARYLDGAIHPLSLLNDMKRGNVSREKIEAVQATSPRLFDQIRSSVLDEAPKLKARLPYEKRLQLSVFFGAPLDDTLQPDFVRSVQDTKSMPPPAKTGQEKRMGSRKPMKLDNTLFATPSEQIAT